MLSSKIVSLKQFQDVLKAIQLVSMSTLHTYKKNINTRHTSLILTASIFKYIIHNQLSNASTILANRCVILAVLSDKSCCGILKLKIISAIKKLTLYLQQKKTKLFLTYISVGTKIFLYFKKLYYKSILNSFLNFEEEAISTTSSYILSTCLKKATFDNCHILFNMFIDTFEHTTHNYSMPSLTNFVTYFLFYTFKNTFYFANNKKHLNIINCIYIYASISLMLFEAVSIVFARAPHVL